MDVRDHAIAELLKLGWSQGQIARALHIAQPSVFKRIQRIKHSGNSAFPSAGSALDGTQGNSLEAGNPPSGPSDVQADLWQGASLDEVLTAAFLHGLRLMKDGRYLHFAYPAGFPPSLRAALERCEDELVDEINRTALRHPPCPACGNRLLFRRREAVRCPVCQGKLLGPDWVWARW